MRLGPKPTTTRLLQKLINISITTSQPQPYIRFSVITDQTRAMHVRTMDIRGHPYLILLVLIIFPIVMKPTTDEISIIANAIMKISEPDVESLCTKPEHTET